MKYSLRSWRTVQEHEIQGAYSPPSSSRLASHHHHHPQLTFLRENILINDNVLHASYKNQTQKLISCLSTCVFPDKVEYPLDESKIHLGPPHESNFGYAHAKRMVDVQNRCVLIIYTHPTHLTRTWTSTARTRRSLAATSPRRYRRTCSGPTTTSMSGHALCLPYCSFISVFPFQRPRRLARYSWVDSQMLPCEEYVLSIAQDTAIRPSIPYTLVRSYSCDADAPISENGTPFVVSGTGKPLRQFIYSHDLAKCFIWMLREYDSVEPVIFSGELTCSSSDTRQLCWKEGPQLTHYSRRGRGGQHQGRRGRHREGDRV